MRDLELATGMSHGLRPLVVLPLVAVLWGFYAAAWHPWLMSWGATPDEIAMALPGDELAPGPYFTRGITIAAPPSIVWPWLVQIGQDRAGFYSNTWLENLTGANIHNADVVRPEWQERRVGDRVPLTRPDLLGGRFTGMFHTDILALDPPILIANAPARFVLRPVGQDATRLLVRETIASQGPAVTRWLAWDPMHFVMVQRMLRGIKERSEGVPLVPVPWRLAARFGWVLAGAGLLLAFVTRRRGRWWLVVPVGLALAPLPSTGDGDAALAAFLAAGITVWVALARGRRFWPPYLLLASAVLLVLLFSPDPYVAFGLGFAVIVMAVASGNVMRRRAESRPATV
jgi:hypothetical protein